MLPRNLHDRLYAPRHEAGLWNAVDAIPGRLTEIGERGRRARRLHLSSAYERGETPEIVYNSAALMVAGPLGVYRKTPPLRDRALEGGLDDAGPQAFCAKTPIGRIGIVICYDGDFRSSRARPRCRRGDHLQAFIFMRTFDHWEADTAPAPTEPRILVAPTSPPGRERAPAASAAR